jgi:hypothetical protein
LLSYPAAIPLSTRTLTRLADLIRTRRRQLRGRWRRLDAGTQALLVLAHLRNGDTYTRLAAGFSIGTTTAWRYVREAVGLLAGLADDVHTTARRAARLAYAILDGTLVPTDRVADQKPYYSGKHKRHGVNVQVLADPAGRLVWASPALPGATHDLAACRARKVDLGYAACAYSLMWPPRIRRRWIFVAAGGLLADAGFGGRWARARCGRCPL